MPSATRVLVVDDAETDATVVRDYLITQEYDVEILHDSREAFDLILDENGFDLLVLDVNLPGLDGVTLTKRLRQQEVLTPILLLSGGVSDEVRLAITTMGPSVAFLEKGASKEVLLASCTDLLSRNHLLMKVCKLDDRMVDLHNLVLEKIPSQEDLKQMVASQLGDHCPSQHASLLEVGVAEQIGGAEERSRAEITQVSEEVMEAIEEATDVPVLYGKAKEHPMVRAIAALIAVILAGYTAFVGYTYNLADGSSRDVIKVQYSIEALSTRLDTNMAQQTQQMNRIESLLDPHRIPISPTSLTTTSLLFPPSPFPTLIGSP